MEDQPGVGVPAMGPDFGVWGEEAEGGEPNLDSIGLGEALGSPFHTVGSLIPHNWCFGKTTQLPGIKEP